MDSKAAAGASSGEGDIFQLTLDKALVPTMGLLKPALVIEKLHVGLLGLKCGIGSCGGSLCQSLGCCKRDLPHVHDTFSHQYTRTAYVSLQH